MGILETLKRKAHRQMAERETEKVARITGKAERKRQERMWKPRRERAYREAYREAELKAAAQQARIKAREDVARRRKGWGQRLGQLDDVFSAADSVLGGKPTKRKSATSRPTKRNSRPTVIVVQSPSRQTKQKKKKEKNLVDSVIDIL